MTILRIYYVYITYYDIVLHNIYILCALYIRNIYVISLYETIL